MFLQVFCVLLLAILANVSSQSCPQGGQIFEWGIDSQGIQDVVNAHNRYRQMVMNGEVPGQPQGKDLKTMVWDDALANQGRRVSQQCQMSHVIAQDGRWGWVGQNLFIAWSSANSDGQDWNSAVEAWYNEYPNFIYPDSNNGKETGHYTQLVNANSEYLGCDFIKYYDVTQPSYPYAKLYTCNYGPGGNIGGQPPYELA